MYNELNFINSGRSYTDRLININVLILYRKKAASIGRQIKIQSWLRLRNQSDKTLTPDIIEGFF